MNRRHTTHLDEQAGKLWPRDVVQHLLPPGQDGHVVALARLLQQARLDRPVPEDRLEQGHVRVVDQRRRRLVQQGGDESLQGERAQPAEEAGRIRGGAQRGVYDACVSASAMGRSGADLSKQRKPKTKEG